MSTLVVPRGWVDDAPILDHQSLSHLTYCIVREAVPEPMYSEKFMPFCKEWTDWISRHFQVDLDMTLHLGFLWRINIPTGLQDLLWKSALGSLPLGCRWYRRLDLGWECQCGTEMSLRHAWEGCTRYNLGPLQEVLLSSLLPLCLGSGQMLDFNEWPTPFWFPLITLRPLEKRLPVGRKQRRQLQDSCRVGKWAISLYLWFVWKVRMHKTADQGFMFHPELHTGVLQVALMPANRVG